MGLHFAASPYFIVRFSTVMAFLQLGSEFFPRTTPALVGAISGLMFMIFRQAKQGQLNLHVSLFLLFTALTFINGILYNANIITAISKIFICFSFSYIIISQLPLLNRKELIKIRNTIIFIAFSTAFIEFYFISGYSINHILTMLTANFYLLKTSTYLFNDTNSLAIYLFGAFSISLMINRTIDCKSPITDFIFFIIILATLSRSVIMTYMLFYLAFNFMNWNTAKKIPMLIISFLLMLTFVQDFHSMIMQDGSGSGKFLIFENFLNFTTSTSNWNLLTGGGMNEGSYVFGIENIEYSHLLIPLLMGQFGFCGFILYFCYFSLFASKCIYNSLLLFCFLIIGFSFLHPFIETIFIANAFFYALSMARIRC